MLCPIVDDVVLSWGVAVDPAGEYELLSLVSLVLSCGETTVALLAVLDGSVGLIGIVVVELAPSLPSASRVLEITPALVVVEEGATLSPLSLDVVEDKTWPSLSASPSGSGEGPSTPGTVAASVDCETDVDVMPAAK